LEEAMLRERGGDVVELECPECGARVRASEEEAAKGKLRCPRGHEFEVMGMLGGAVGDTPRRPL
jgi:hypothetical protein